MNDLLKMSKNLVKKGDEFIHRNGTKKFHEKASELLIKACLHDIFSFQDLIKSSFSPSFNHEQNFKAFEFSDLPLTIARGKNCFIDVYFWRRRPTTIHNHHFSGAFQCLLGSNVDSEFKFRKKKVLTKFHTLGELIEVDRREVHPGDVIPIDLQDKFIHQNHHHADLTVNLCFRTQDQEGIQLSNYLYSGLKLEKDPGSLQRAERLLAFLKIDDFDVRDLNLTMIDAFNFVTFTHSMGIQHPRYLKLRKILEKRIKDEFDLSLGELLRKHDRQIDLIQQSYE